MSANNLTKKLYVAFREACMTHDELRAIELIRQIIEMDPSDESAKEQLKKLYRNVAEGFISKLRVATERRDTYSENALIAQIESIVPPEIAKSYSEYNDVKNRPLQQPNTSETKKIDNGRIKRLYNQLREALMAHQDDKSFDLLQEIIGLDPSDDDARMQAIEVGKRLCNEKTAQLSTMLHREDAAGIEELLAQMQKWAHRDFLATLPGFYEAEKLLANVRRKENEIDIQKRIQNLRVSYDSIEEKNEQADEIENLARKHNILLETSDRDCLTHIHKRYEIHVRNVRCEQLAAEIREELSSLIPSKNALRNMSTVKLNRKLEGLEQAIQVLREMEDHPLISELKAEACEYIKQINTIIDSRFARKRIHRAVARLFLLFALLMGGIGYYIYYTQETIAAQLQTCITEKDAERARELATDTSFVAVVGDYVGNIIPYNYVRTKKEVRNWLNELDGVMQKATELTAKLRQRLDEGNTTLETLDKDRELVRQWDSMNKQLQKQYHVSANKSDKQLWEDFELSMINNRSKLLDEVLYPPQAGTFKELSHLWKKYCKNMDFFKQSGKEKESIRDSFFTGVKAAFMSRTQNSSFENLRDYWKEYLAYSSDFSFSKKESESMRSILLDRLKEIFANYPQNCSFNELCAAWKEYLKYSSEFNFSNEENMSIRQALRTRMNNIFENYPLENSLDALWDLWDEFGKAAASLNYNQEEKEDVHRACLNRASRWLLCKDMKNIPDEKMVRDRIEIYRKHHDKLASLNGEELQMLLKAVISYSVIDKSLAATTSVKDYISELDRIEPLYNRLDFIYNLEDLQKIDTNVCNNLALQLAIENKGITYGEKSHQVMNNILSIFKDGKDVYYEYNKKISDCIESINEEKPDIWADGYVQFTCNGYIYVGNITDVENNSYNIHTLDETGAHMSNKVSLPIKQTVKKKIELSKVRDRLGLSLRNLQAATVAPADHLTRIASSDAPPLVRAWLFKEMILLMEAYSEPLATGVFFSEQLKNDIERFKELERKYSIQLGCWMAKRPAKTDAEFADFFKSVASHNYSKEIIESITGILNAKLKFVGFVNSKGEIQVRGSRDVPLYTIEFTNSKPAIPVLKRINSDKVPLFTPLFTM